MLYFHRNFHVKIQIPFRETGILIRNTVLEYGDAQFSGRIMTRAQLFHPLHGAQT